MLGCVIQSNTARLELCYVSNVSGLPLIQPSFFIALGVNMHRRKIQLCPLVKRKRTIYFHRESDAA